MGIKIKMDLTKEMANKITISTQATDMHGNYTMQVPRFVAKYFMWQLSFNEPKKVEPVSGRIQIIESETQPDGYAIACDNDINGDDLIALLARTRKSERWRMDSDIKQYLEHERILGKIREAGFLSHTDEQQELAQWKGLALAMSKLILENDK